MKTDTLPVLPFAKAANNGQIVEGDYTLPVDPSILDIVQDDALGIKLSLQCFSVPKYGVEGKLATQVTLICQRTGQSFRFPIVTQFKLFERASSEDDESLQLTDEGMLEVKTLVEEEILLALPLVPIKPGTEGYLKIYSETKSGNAFSQLKDLVD